MKEIRLNVSDEQYDMIMRVSRKRRKSVRAIILRVFYELEHSELKKK